MKRRTWLCVALLPLLASCANMLGPRDVSIPLSRLQQAVDKKFPYNNRTLGVLDINLAHPVVSLLSDKNRVQISMDTDAVAPLLNKSWKGNLAASGTLALDQGRQAVVLAAPRLDMLNIDGADSGSTGLVRQAGSLFLERVLQDMPLYTFDPDQFSYLGVTFTPTAIVTKQDSLVVTFEPVR